MNPTNVGVVVARRSPKQWLRRPNSDALPKYALGSGSFFLRVHRVGWDLMAGEDQMAFVGDDPIDGLPLGKLHGLSHCGGEVDIPLLAGSAFDDLDFGWESHRQITSHITRPTSIEIRVFF